MAETKARVFVLAGPDLARSFPLGARATLGRSDECDVVLRDRSISRKHAELVHEAERWFVQDLGSTNGVTKDGQRGERFELADGDEFRLGDLPLRFKLETEAVAQEIEFDLGPPVVRPAPSAPSVPPPAPAPRVPEPVKVPLAVPLAKEPAVEDEVEIEEVEEIEIEGPGPGPRSAPRPPPAPTAFTPHAARRTGFFASDVEQQPFWLRCLLFLGLVAIGALLAYGAFQAVQMLRAGT